MKETITFDTLQQKDTEYIANTYARVPLDVQAGVGATCHDLSGKQYIDFSSGIGVNSLGFANPTWVEAVTQQIHVLSHMSNLYYTTPQVALAEALCQRTEMKKVFFANSGAEANEGAIKTARKYGEDHYGANRYEIITLENSFHGRTITTLAATGQEVFHKHFGPFPKGFVHAKPNDIEDMKAKVTENTCAIFLELIQGEGGVLPLDKDYVAEIAALCQKKDILLLVDEVQTGVGRTGTFLCCEQYEIRPDVVTLAKGLGGGLPIGAVLFGDKTKDTLGFGDHATTFGGNPIVTAGANAVLETLTPALLVQVKGKEELIRTTLAASPYIQAISGKGLMLGLELAPGLDNREVVAAAGKQGLILLTAKHKVRLLPPLTISEQELTQGLAVLLAVLNEKGAAI